MLCGEIHYFINVSKNHNTLLLHTYQNGFKTTGYKCWGRCGTVLILNPGGSTKLKSHFRKFFYKYTHPIWPNHPKLAAAPNPSFDKWMNKMWFFFTLEFYSATERYGVLMYIAITQIHYSKFKEPVSKCYILYNHSSYITFWKNCIYWDRKQIINDQRLKVEKKRVFIKGWLQGKCLEW